MHINFQANFHMLMQVNRVMDAVSLFPLKTFKHTGSVPINLNCRLP